MVCAITSLTYSKWPCVLHTLYDIIFSEHSMFFFVTSWLVTVTVTMSSNVTDVWQYDPDITLTLILNPNKENKSKRKKVKEK